MRDYMNFDLKMEEMMNNINEGTKLLLHACCAPCSSAVLERLGNFFSITILYYNPNITDSDEYIKRLNEIKSFISKFKTKYPIEVIDGRYDQNEFFTMSKGLEEEKERGAFKRRTPKISKKAPERELFAYNFGKK